MPVPKYRCEFAVSFILYKSHASSYSFAGVYELLQRPLKAVIAKLCF